MNVLNTDTVYKFIFSNGYENANGTFRLVKIMTYSEYLADGGNILTDFYEPCGKTEADTLNDIEQLQRTDILKMVNPNSVQVVETKYAPAFLLKETPDHNVQEYKKFGIVAFIGITKDAADLEYVNERIREQFETSLGITPDPKFIYTESTWLTEDEYQDELAKRDDTKKKAFTYFSENKKYEKLVSQLTSQIEAYEEIIKQQNEQLNP